MIAFHFPPQSMGSGTLRTLKFSRYLSENSWLPAVLTVSPRAYPHSDSEARQLAEVPKEVIVKRAPAVDAGRHLAISGRYLRVTSIPDRWANWWLSAVPLGLRLIRSWRPDVIWSTYPIATAHLIGLSLHRMTGVPWVADFRDSMTEPGYPRDRLTRASYVWIEKQTVRHAAAVIFTAESSRRMYLERYPELASKSCQVILNGYDEDDFRDLEAGATPPSSRPLRVVHSGVVYPEERDPSCFFRALSRLKHEGRITAGTVSVDLLACGNEEQYRQALRSMAIDDIVRLQPPVPYHKALRTCAEADALLVLQGASCDHQIPAKLFEYLRLGKPIIALTGSAGDTAGLLRETGGATIVELSDEDAIHRALPKFFEALRTGQHPLPSENTVRRYARRQQAAELAACLGRAANKS